MAGSARGGNRYIVPPAAGWKASFSLSRSSPRPPVGGNVINFDPPADLRDQVWMPARFTWDNQGEAVGFVPTRYPGSATAEAALQLSRRTDWYDAGADWPLPLGQRARTDLRRYVVHGS